MKLSNGASITSEDGLYSYEHEHLTLNDYPLEEFVEELQDLGVIDEFLVSVNHAPREIFAISSSNFEPVTEKEEPDLETCYERVIEDLARHDTSTGKGFDAQMRTLGILTANKNAISNNQDTDAP